MIEKSVRLLACLAAFLLAAGGVVAVLAPPAQASYITVYGGPTYDPASGTGFTDGYGLAVNDAGTAVGYATKYAAGTWMGDRAFRWDAWGSPPTELGTLGTDASGTTNCRASAINTLGTVAGYALKYVGGANLGARAVRWDASGTDATELGEIGTDLSGTTYCQAWAINTAGTAVGFAYQYVGGFSKGSRAVRWDASGTDATELGNLGTTASGTTYCNALAINTAGTAAGDAYKYVGGAHMGCRAVRWDASGTAATELGNLGADASGYTNCDAYSINAAGAAVGFACKYVGGSLKGARAVRWDASGTAATELGNLGTDADGITDAYPKSINDAGTAVGYARKYEGGVDLGSRAVRWDASGTAATELGNLGTDAFGVTGAYAYAINDAGMAVGSAYKYVGGAYAGQHAVYWGLDGVAVDLNDLIDPSTGWILTNASAISDTGWVTGCGQFASYQRGFLMQVPEPATLSLLALGGMGALLRRKRK